VVADSEGTVDYVATEALRAEIEAGRGELPLFDYGPGIDALRSHCEAETGLPAPVQPVWTTLREAAE
jgi:N-methylhydantoinase B